MLSLKHVAINIGTQTSLGQLAPNTCPVKRGVSAASFDAAGLGERTGHVCRRTCYVFQCFLSALVPANLCTFLFQEVNAICVLMLIA